MKLTLNFSWIHLMGWVLFSKVVHMCLLSPKCSQSSWEVYGPGIHQRLSVSWIHQVSYSLLQILAKFICMLLWLIKENYLESFRESFSFQFFFPQPMNTSVMCWSDNSLTPKKTKKQPSKALDIKAIFCMVCCETLQVGPLFKDGSQTRCLKFHHQRAS